MPEQKKSMPWVLQSCVKFGSCTSDEWFLSGAGYTFLANDGWKLVRLLPSSWHLKLQMTRKSLQEEHFSAFNGDHQLSPQSTAKNLLSRYFKIRCAGSQKCSGMVGCAQGPSHEWFLTPQPYDQPTWILQHDTNSKPNTQKIMETISRAACQPLPG